MKYFNVLIKKTTVKTPQGVYVLHARTVQTVVKSEETSYSAISIHNLFLVDDYCMPEVI